MREARWRSFALRVCLLISLLSFLYLALRRAVGAAYFRKGSPEAVLKAMKWDPGNPEYYDALGTLNHLLADRADSDEIVRLYHEATRLSPNDAQFWADLGAGYDWAGHSDDALNAYRRAQLLFPHSPEINWRLANFYVRAGRTQEALDTLRMVLQQDRTAARRVFTLATNATRDRNALLQVLPPQPSVFFDYLAFLNEKGDIAAAEEVWKRVLQLAKPFDLQNAFPYLDALIQHKEVDQLSGAWASLSQRFPAQIQQSATPNLVTNGSFESNILNGGLDWRILPVEGVVVTQDTAVAFDGARALRITFDGSRNIDYGHAFQYVPVQPRTRYRFSCYMRVQGITTDSAPKFQVSDAYQVSKILASTENLVGAMDWTEERAEFTTLPDTHLLLVRVVRLASAKLDNRLAGTVWIDDVRLTSS